MTKIAIIGAAGRMGLALTRCARQVHGLEIVAAVEAAASPAVGKDPGVVAGAGETGLRITSDLAAAVQAADIAIDFSFHENVPQTARLAARHGKGLVIGTTGLTPEERATVEQADRTIPIMWAPNMSQGVNLLFALTQRAAAALGLDYDAEIVEMHHRLKKDAPSGTALRLAETVAVGRGQDLKAVAVYGREGLVGERPHGEIGVHAVRGGDVVGDHTVIFAIEGERVELTHKASSRDILARGALRAALWLPGRKPGLYDMQDVLGLR